MSDGFKIISSGLLITNMGVERGVSGSTSEVLAISEGDVLPVGALVAFG